MNVYISNYEVNDVADYVVYGINGNPDKIANVKPGSNHIVSMENDRINYVSGYIVFTNGTSSDIRRAE